jgi:hypothetical protein
VVQKSLCWPSVRAITFRIYHLKPNRIGVGVVLVLASKGIQREVILRKVKPALIWVMIVDLAVIFEEVTRSERNRGTSD